VSDRERCEEWLNRGDSLRAREGAQRTGSEWHVDSLVQIFVGGIEEKAIFEDRTTDPATVLIEAQRSGLVTGIEVVSSVRPVIADVLDRRPMERMRTRFGDDRDLPARAAAEFGVVVAAFDVKFLNVLEAL